MEYGLSLFQSKREFSWKDLCQSAKGFIHIEGFFLLLPLITEEEKIIKLFAITAVDFLHMDEFIRQLVMKTPSFLFILDSADLL